MMIWDYINAMENKDYVALSKCFSENCRLFDYCPGNIGQENFFIYGQRALTVSPGCITRSVRGASFTSR